MFYPFNAARAKTRTSDAERDNLIENEVLADAYISITHVYIERAAKRGYSRTTTYIPYSVSKEVVERLRGAGFEVEPFLNTHNRYMVSWE
jgi:hypothetical protein